jgi:hypothetical protein
MKKYLNLFTALLASLQPKSGLPIIDTYGQSTFTQDQQQDLMEWLFASLMGAGYFGKAHLIWTMVRTGNERCLLLYRTHSRRDALFALKFVQIPLNRSLINPYFRFKTLVSS